MKLKIEYDTSTNERGLNRIDGDDAIYINEAIVRFAHMRTKGGSAPHFIVYDDTAELLLHTNELELYVDERLEEVIQSMFRKECINDNNIHEYIVRLYCVPSYGNANAKPFWNAHILRHEQDLPRYSHSPANTEMFVGEYNGEWTDEEIRATRELREYSLSLPFALTRTQFISFLVQRIQNGNPRSTRARCESLWEKRKEMGFK